MTKFPPGFSSELAYHLTQQKPPLDDVTGVPIMDLENYCCGTSAFLQGGCIRCRQSNT